MVACFQKKHEKVACSFLVIHSRRSCGGDCLPTRRMSTEEQSSQTGSPENSPDGGNQVGRFSSGLKNELGCPLTFVRTSKMGDGSHRVGHSNPIGDTGREGIRQVQ